MKKFFSTILIFTMFTIGATFAGGAFVTNELSEDVAARMNEKNSTKIHKIHRFAIKCPNCKVKNYYSAKKFSKRKLVCNYCGQSFKTGKVFHKGKKIRKLKNSGYGNAKIKNLNY